MRLLVIDTCGGQGSIALVEDGKVVVTEELPGRSASERLVPVIHQAMEAQGWKLGSLTAIAVVHGPGSFTGVRVGLSAAKGLSEAVGVPIVAISRLAVLALKEDGPVAHAVFDAGRGELYYGEYRGGRCIVEALYSPAEAAASAGEEPVVFCEDKVQEMLTGCALQRVAEPAAADAVSIAIARVAAKKFDDAALLDANYLRRSDVQLFARQQISTP